MERFWSKVDIKCDDECWPWKAGKCGIGYGHFKLYGSHVLAHRMAWTLTNGPIPDGLNILHKCDNILCCNPNHLYAGTQSDNMSDRAARNPNNQCTQSKITDKEVFIIRDVYKGGGFTYLNLANIFAISGSHIANIVSGVRR